MAPHTARHGAHRHSQGAVRTRTEQHVAPDATERVYEPATRRRKHATPEEIEYDIVVLFAERQSDLQQQGEDAYVCRTVRSIMHRAKFTSLSLSFSGVRGDALESIYASCPELRLLPTAVFSTEQAALLEEIVTILGPRMDTKRGLFKFPRYNGPHFEYNPASKITPQWFTMKNALNMVPADSGRPLIIMEDDVVLAEDFDTLLRAAILEAEQHRPSGEYAMSLYVGNSQNTQVNDAGEIEAIRLDGKQPTGSIELRWQFQEQKSLQDDAIKLGKTGFAGSVFERFQAKQAARKVRTRGDTPMIVDYYVWGHQAVVYNSPVHDDFRAFYTNCEQTMMKLLQKAKNGEPVSPDDEDPCIQVADWYNLSFISSRKPKTPFYTTRDSLVQHIGIRSSIQNVDGKENQLFHQNVELGTVSEDYTDAHALILRESLL